VCVFVCVCVVCVYFVCVVWESVRETEREGERERVCVCACGCVCVCVFVKSQSSDRTVYIARLRLKKLCNKLCYDIIELCFVSVRYIQVRSFVIMPITVDCTTHVQSDCVAVSTWKQNILPSVKVSERWCDFHVWVQCMLIRTAFPYFCMYSRHSLAWNCRFWNIVKNVGSQNCSQKLVASSKSQRAKFLHGVLLPNFAGADTRGRDRLVILFRDLKQNLNIFKCRHCKCRKKWCIPIVISHRSIHATLTFTFGAQTTVHALWCVPLDENVYSTETLCSIYIWRWVCFQSCVGHWWMNWDRET